MNKKRVSLTLDSNLVSRIDRKVENHEFKNRSQAIEKIVRDSINNERVNKALILSGGDFEGKTPESMINFNGKPLLEHTLEHLSTQGIEKVVIALGKEHEKVRNYFGESWKNIEIEYMVEETPLGTAGCLKKAKRKFKDTFIMMNGDIYCKVDLKDMLSRHRRNKSIATIALTTIEDISPYGVAKLKGDKIIGFIEKPSKENAPSNLINAGVYIMEPEVIDLIPEEKPSQIESVFEKLSEGEKLYGYVYEGEWRDIGT